MKKVVGIVVVVGLLAAGGYYFFFVRGAKTAAGEKKEATAVARKGDLVVSISSTGRVISNQDVEVKCKAGGQVTTVSFDVSDRVKNGDLLVELDPIDEQRKVAQGEVSLSVSQAKLAIARENLAIAERTLVTDERRARAALLAAESHAKDALAKADRMKQLLAKKLASQEDCDTAETAAVQAAADLEAAKTRIEELKTQRQQLEVKRQEVKQAEATVKADEIMLAIAKDRLRDTKVVSPMNGVVSKRDIQVGQMISSATSNVGGGTPLMTLSDLSRVFVVASVDESDIGAVAVGQPVGITVDAFPGKRFTGKVVRIATMGVNLSNVVTFEVKIEVLGERKSLLKPEMTADVEIVTARRDGVLLVPSEAVVRKASGRFVTVVGGPAKEDRKVEIGLTDGVRTEVVSGLAEGKAVVVYKGGAQSRWDGRPRGMMMGGRGRGLR